MNAHHIARNVVWKNSFRRRRRIRKFYQAAGYLIFVGLVVGAFIGVAKIFGK